MAKKTEVNVKGKWTIADRAKDFAGEGSNIQPRKVDDKPGMRSTDEAKMKRWAREGRR